MSFFENPNSEMEPIRYWIKKAYFCFKLGQIDEYNHILREILPKELAFLPQNESSRSTTLETLLQKEYQSLEQSWLTAECVVALLQKTNQKKPWYAHWPFLRLIYKKKQKPSATSVNKIDNKAFENLFKRKEKN